MATPRSTREGRGLVTSFTAVCCARTVWDQSQCSILSHEPCYHKFDRKLQGVNQLGNHKQLLCQSSQTNYAALALAQWSKCIPVQQEVAAKVTRLLPSLAERGVATRN